MRNSHRNLLVQSAAASVAAALLAPAIALAQTPQPQHRYSFTLGSELVDSVGGQNAVNAGGVTFANNTAVFPGGPANGNGFLTLPAGILPTTAAASASMESWQSIDANTGNWSRLFDFGASTTRYFFLSPRNGGNTIQVGLNNNAGDQSFTAGGNILLSPGASVQRHTAVVFDNAADQLRLYVDGLLLATRANTTSTLEGFPQTQNFLGKAQFADPQLLGNINEFRIYHAALNSGDVYLNYAAGPDQLATSRTLSAATGNLAGSVEWGGVAPAALQRSVIANGGNAVANSALAIGQVQVVSGSLDVNAGADLTLAGGLHLNAGAGQTATVNLNTGGKLTAATVLADGPATGTRTIAFNGGELATTETRGNFVLPVGLSVSAAGGTLNNAGSLEFTGNVTGTGNLVKRGAGVLYFTGAANLANYTGTTHVQQGGILLSFGTVDLGTTNAKIILEDDTFLRNNGTRTINRDIEFRGSTVGSFLDIGGAQLTTVNGNLTLAGSAALRPDGGSRFIVNGNVTATGDQTLFLAGADQTHVINGSVNLGTNGSLVKQGNAIWTLNGATNTWGDTQISGGTLRIGNGGATGGLGQGAVFFTGNATLDIRRSGSITLDNLLFDAGGAGTVRLGGPGTVTITNPANAYTGGTFVDGGLLLVPDWAPIPTGIVTVNAQGAVAQPAGVPIMSFLTPTPRVTAASTGALALQENSSEAIDFTGYNVRLGATGNYTYSGAITPNGDVYRFGGGGGTLTVATNLADGFVNPRSLEVGGGLSQVVLAGNNTYTGSTTVRDGGALLLNGIGDLDLSPALIVNSDGIVRFAPGATGNTDLTALATGLTVSNGTIDTNGNDVTFASKNLVGTGGYFTKNGAGKLTMTVNASPANVFVRQGTLELAGSSNVTTSAWTSIGQNAGDNGTLNLRGNAILTVNSDFNAGDVGDAAQPLNTGTVNVSENAQLRIRRLFLGKAVNTTGVLNQTGGIVAYTGTSGGDWQIGGATAAGNNVVGTYNLSGGALEPGTLNLQIGAYGKGTLTQTGGTHVNGGYLAVGRYAGSVGVYDMSTGNGTFTHTAAFPVRPIIGEEGNGTLRVGGNSVFDVQGMQLAAAAGSVGTIEQTGGTVRVRFGRGLFAGAGTASYVLSGGLLDMNPTLAATGNPIGDGAIDPAGARAIPFTFTGGELRNAGSYKGNLTHSGTALLSVLNNDTLIKGGYTNNGGTTRINAGRTLTVEQGVVLGAAATFAPQIASASSFGKITATGAASVGGLIAPTLVAGFTPGTADAFTVLTASAVSGSFANAFGYARLPDGKAGMAIETTATSVVLRGYQLVGDIDLSGAVNNQDIAPFVALLTGGNAAGAVGFSADVDGNGVVNNQDIAPFVALLTGGRPLADLSGDPEFAPLMALVPEPATLSLVAAAGVLALRRRRAC
jgi:autotransporter-associated beta strand protein